MNVFANNGKTCGKGAIFRTRYCVANNTNCARNNEDCLKKYPAEKSKIDCFVDCYGNMFHFYSKYSSIIIYFLNELNLHG